MAAITYPLTVRSLAHMFPDLLHISALASHNINEGKDIGDPFDINAAYDAEKTVQELEPLSLRAQCFAYQSNSGIIPAVSHVHIEAAKNRAHVLRAIHANATVGAVDVLARLDEIQRTQNTTRAITNENQVMLQETRAMLQETRAMVMNVRLASQNAKVPQERNHYKPLQKTRSGHGRELAFQVSRPENINHLPLPATIQPAALGTVPPFFDRNTDTYTLGTINSLIIFYNDDFDIEKEDNLEIRKIKFRRWLCS
ncbi:uncharacterized protein F5147DRAFT_779253 [Suillus discolor]|uniref:Uncharacterized protein n=1 Tax=Suillus discolor TaxID=1912936 RepID=A0A9P7JP36_9AGAM|nr:uncharacterized protein F5147DRAFT_779253 [Suillus discolor]KAG2093735.1 hypothetical protein F5147DRAFT_779253 [Suillus discolor]